ncbi:MAG: hypothetical protein R3B90_02130 [Planctomycetaceae bacterium]
MDIYAEVFAPLFIVMAVITTLVVAFRWGKPRWGAYTGLLAVCFGALSCNLWVTLLALLLLALAFCSQFSKLSAPGFAVTAAAALLTVSGLAAWTARDTIARVVAARERFPVVSVQPRLEYEQVAGEQIAAPTTIDLVPENRETLARSMREYLHPGAPNGYWVRNWSLRNLHRTSALRFVTGAGFGIQRMSGLDVTDLPLEPIEPIEPTCPLPDPSLSDARHADLPTGLDSLHWLGAGNFLSETQMGDVLGDQRVVGFEPHAFSSPAPTPASYRLQELLLVSLLKQVGPRVYESDYLPNMAELSSGTVPTRPLDDFETAALERLRGGEDIVVDESRGDEVRMLGSLRAIEQCLNCHSVPKGTLLGAFTYRLAQLPMPTSDPEATHEEGTEN